MGLLAQVHSQMDAVTAPVQGPFIPAELYSKNAATDREIPQEQGHTSGWAGGASAQ